MRTTTGQAESGSGHLEMEFLLCCVRRRYDPSAPMCDSRGVNWDRLSELAMRHRVLPLLYQQVELSAGNVPDAARAGLKDLYLRNAARNMNRAADLQKLAAIFRSQDIPVMFLRGLVIAETLYGDMALRQFSDLDLLAHPEDVRRISALLAGEGCRPQFDLDERQERALILFQTERCFIRSADQSAVDLHWRLLPEPFAFNDEDALWGRRIRVTIQGLEVQTLTDEDTALFLCIHGAKHGWHQLALVCDLAEMMRVRPGLDWDAILQRARKRGKKRIVLAALRLVSELLGTAVPEKVKQAAADQAVRQLVEELKRRLMCSAGVQEGRREKEWRVVWNLLERWRDRFAYLAYLVTTPTGIEFEKITLPRALFPVYYLLRIGRMAGKLFRRGAVRSES